MGVPGYDRDNDPSPDVCTTEVTGDDSFTVYHFPNMQAKTPCCTVKVKIKAEDVKHPGGAAIGALARADRMIARKHAERSSTKDNR